MKELIKQIKKARFVFVCGNGGSAATAEHLTNDLFSKGIRAICLNSNVSIMTMIANDFDYQHVFSRQLKLYATSDDLLITISCSGISDNTVDAILEAREIKMKIYEFERFKYGLLNSRNYGKLENKHLQLVHKIKEAL